MEKTLLKTTGFKAEQFVHINNVRISCTEFVFQQILGLLFWVTGSRSEGIHLNKSDTDFIVCAPDIEARINNPCTSTDESKVILQNIEIKPGYALLKVLENDLTKIVQISRDIHGSFMDLCTKVNEEYFLSTSKVQYAWSFHAATILPWTGAILRKQEQNGPAKQVTVEIGNKSVDMDALYVIKCTNLPQNILDFFKRERTWPTTDIITKLKSLPVFLVAVGNPLSKTVHNREWKYSFNLQERELMRRLTREQLICYSLLKALQFQAKAKFHGLFKSYFLKTCFLWTLETKTTNDWNEATIINNAIDCLKYFTECIKRKTCEHYFIQMQNIFDGKSILTENSRALTDFISSISNEQNEIWKNLFQQLANTLDKKYLLKQPLLNSLSVCRHVLISSVCSTDTKTAFLRMQDIRDKVVRLNPAEYDKDWIHYMHLTIQSHLGTLQAILSPSNSNKSYNDFLKHGENFDLYSGNLKTATVLYSKGQYDTALKITENVIERNAENTIYFTGFSVLKDKQFKDLENSQKVWKQLLPENVYFDIVFLPSEIEICPAGIQLQLSEQRVIVLNPLVYAYYLKFCILSQHKSKGNDIDELLIKFGEILSKQVKGGMGYIDWELLSYCHYIMGDYYKAFDFLLVAKGKRDIGNTIVWQLALIIHALMSQV